MLIWSFLKNKKLVNATADDWYVVFDIDAEKKILAISFYPIVAFRIDSEETECVMSRPSLASKVATARPARKVNDSLWGVSVSYGRWVRDDSLFDEKGNPEMYGNGESFSRVIEGYLQGDFSLNFRTGIPTRYHERIVAIHEKVKTDAE